MKKILWKRQRLEIKKALDKHYLVEKFYHSYRGLGEYFVVDFVGDVREVWQVRPGPRYKSNGIYFSTRRVINLPVTNHKIGRRPQRYTEFESIGNKYRSLFIYPRNKLRKLSVVDRRLFIHELADELLNEGWIDLKYPLEILSKDYDEFLNNDYMVYQYTPNKFVAVNGKKYRCRKIVEHFFPISSYKGDGNRLTVYEGWSNRRMLYTAISSLMAMGVSISRTNIVRHMFGNYDIRIGPRMPNPCFWRAVINTLTPDITSIHDIDPGWGGKALAAAAQGIKYRYSNTQFAESFNEMGDFICADIAKYDGEQCDLCILNNLPLCGTSAINRLDKFHDNYKYCMVFVYMPDVDDVITRFGKPERRRMYTFSGWKPLSRSYILLYQN